MDTAPACPLAWHGDHLKALNAIHALPAAA